MIRKYVLATVLVLCAMAQAGEAQKKYKMLYVTQSGGFQHGSVKRPQPGVLAPSEIATTEIGNESGLFEVECTQDVTVLTPEKLKDLDIVMFYTTGKFVKPGEKGFVFTPENFAAFDAWIKSGKAFIGVHSATDTGDNTPGYFQMINGTFDGHPWGSGTTVTITNHEPTHPAVKMYEPQFKFKDEIYQYKNYDPKSVRVLLSLNMEECNPKEPRMVPVSWVRDVGQGRLFYTNLGHNEGTWKDAKFREHLLMGIRWALKLEQGPSEPNPELQAEVIKKSRAAAAKGWAKDIAGLAGKSADEIAPKMEKIVADDAALDQFLKDARAVRGIDAKKDAEKKKAEAIKLYDAIAAK